MRFPVGLGLMCALLFGYGCARPSLGDDDLEGVEEDGGAGQRDGKLPAGDDDDDSDDDNSDDDDADDDMVVEDAGRRDAGQDSGRRDTGAAEDDGGGSENDAGENEDAGCTGDDCPEPGSECDAEALPSQLQIGGASVSAIRIDGTAGTFANVAPGASVRVQFQISFSDCNLIPMPRQVYVGLESAAPECQPALCSSIGTPPNGDFMLNAPSEQGLHYISIGIDEGGLFCAADGRANTHLAALCVTP